MSLYQCRDAKDGVFEIKKFDEDFNLLSVYEVIGSDCSCPAYKSYCKHRKMVSDFKSGKWPAKPGEFYNDKTGKVTKLGE